MEDANINTALEAEKEFVKNPICITAYEQHQKYLRDKKARESFLRKEGEAKVVAALIASGMSVEEIADRLKMNVITIQQLLK